MPRQLLPPLRRSLHQRLRPRSAPRLHPRVPQPLRLCLRKLQRQTSTHHHHNRLASPKAPPSLHQARHQEAPCHKRRIPGTSTQPEGQQIPTSTTCHRRRHRLVFRHNIVLQPLQESPSLKLQPHKPLRTTFTPFSIHLATPHHNLLPQQQPPNFHHLYRFHTKACHHPHLPLLGPHRDK